jgi:hypothetical protein
MASIPNSGTAIRSCEREGSSRRVGPPGGATILPQSASAGRDRCDLRIASFFLDSYPNLAHLWGIDRSKSKTGRR